MNAQRIVQDAHYMLARTFDRIRIAQESPLARWVIEFVLSARPEHRSSKRLFLSSPFYREGTRQMIARLAEEGWVVRKQSVDDGRKLEVWPSSKLLDVLESAAESQEQK
jgi:hypothetical protein